MLIMEMVVTKFKSFRDAEEANREYYLSLTPEQRLEILFQLWEIAHKEKDGTTPRLAHVYRITKLPRR